MTKPYSLRKPTSKKAKTEEKPKATPRVEPSRQTSPLPHIPVYDEALANRLPGPHDYKAPLTPPTLGGIHRGLPLRDWKSKPAPPRYNNPEQKPFTRPVRKQVEQPTRVKGKARPGLGMAGHDVGVDSDYYLRHPDNPERSLSHAELKDYINAQINELEGYYDYRFNRVPMTQAKADEVLLNRSNNPIRNYGTDEYNDVINADIFRYESNGDKFVVHRGPVPEYLTGKRHDR